MKRRRVSLTKECAICNKVCRDGIIDFDTDKSAHIHCFFDKQNWLECGDNYSSFIRNNPINGKWYMYNYDNDYKHSEKPIEFCPFCGVKLDKHE